MSELKQQLNDAVKQAMKAKQKERLATLRLATSALKQIEVDERIELDDARVLAVLDKMIKQRKDSAEQFTAGGREDLATQEKAEIEVLQEFLPAALDGAEIEAIVNEQILANTPVQTRLMDIESARNAGAMALFGEKYDDEVRVLSMGENNFSMELCGGTHVSRTGDIGLFKITSEGASSSA